MKTFYIEIKEELSNYIERLNFEVNAKERIVKSMLGDNSYNNLMENDNFLKYQEKYEVAFAEYEIMKQELMNMIPQNLRDGHQLSWNLDFATRELSITFNCDCFDGVNEIDNFKEKK